MARVYLETSFVSACVTKRDDTSSRYRKRSSVEWWQQQASRHELFISPEVLRELADPRHHSAAEAASFVEHVPILPLDPPVVGFAEALVRHKVMPGPAVGDALHVAVCCVWAAEYLLTWNVRQLANHNKITHLRAVCLRAGLVPPTIVTPDLLWET